MIKKDNVELSELELREIWKEFKKCIYSQLDEETQTKISASTDFPRDSAEAKAVLAAFTSSFPGLLRSLQEGSPFFTSFSPQLKLFKFMLRSNKSLCTESLLDLLSTLLLNTTPVGPSPDYMEFLTTIIDSMLILVKDHPEEVFLLDKSFVCITKHLFSLSEEILSSKIILQDSFLSENNRDINLNYLGYLLLVIDYYISNSKFDHNHLDGFSMFRLCINVMCIPEEPLEVGGQEIGLCAVHAFGILLNILKKIQISKIEVARMILETWERVKKLFIVSSDILAVTEPGEYLHAFSKDTTALSQLYESALDLFLKCASVESIFDDNVIIIFQLLIQDASRTTKNASETKLKGFILEFLYRYFYNEDREQNPSKGTGPEELIFSRFIFMSISEEVREVWESIWRRISCSSNSTGLAKALVQNLRNYVGDCEYLEYFLEWIKGVGKKDGIVLEMLGKAEITSKIIEIMPVAMDREREVLFQIGNLFFGFGEPLMIIENVLNVLVLGGHFFRYCRIWITELLRRQIEDVFQRFIDYFSKQNNLMIIECLIDCIMQTMEEIKGYAVQQLLIRKGFLKALGDILPIDIIKKEDIISLWELCFKCLNRMLANCELSVHSIDFNFFSVIHTIRLETYREIRPIIIAKTIEIIKQIVISQDCLTFKLPSGSSLIFEYICCVNSSEMIDLAFKFEKLIKNPANFNHFVNNGATSIFLYHLGRNSLSEVVEKLFEKFFVSAISCQISYPDFSQIITILKNQKDLKRKQWLMSILYNSLDISVVNASNSKDFYFSRGTYISLESQNNVHAFNKEYSIAVWVYPESHTCVLFSILCNPDSFTLKLIKDRVVLDVGNNSLRGEEVTFSSWNLVVVNFKFTKKAKVLTSKKITIIVNTKKTKIKDSHKLNFSQQNLIKNIIIGKSQTKSEDFQGRISSLSLFTSRIKRNSFALLKSLLKDYSFTHTTLPQSQEDPKLLKDLQTKLLLCISPYTLDCMSNIKSDFSCDLIGGASVYLSIQAYNPQRFLLDLFEACKDREESLTKFYEIILRLILGIQHLPMINNDTIRLLGYLLNSGEISERINELYVMMIKSCPSHLAKDLLESYLCKIQGFSGKGRYLNVVLKMFKELFPYNKENLYRICMLMQGIEVNKARNLIVEYFGEDFEEKITKNVAHVLIALAKSKQVIQIQGILAVLEKFHYSFGSFTAISTALLYILKTIESPNVQVSILKIFCINENYEKYTSVENTEENKSLLYLIDEMLPNEIDPSVVELLLEQKLVQGERMDYIKCYLIDIVFKRLGFITSPVSLGIIQKFVYLCSDNEIMKYIYNRGVFPEWLLRFHKNPNAVGVISEFTVLIFSTAISKGCFEKFKIFFTEYQSINYYIEIFTRVKNKDSEILFEFIEVLNGFNKNYIQENMENYLKALNLFLNHKIYDLFAESMSMLKVLRKTSKTPTKKMMVKKEKHKFILLEYIQTLLNSINTYPNTPDFTKMLETLLSYDHFKYFCKYINSHSNTDKKLCESMLSVYLFTELCHIHYDRHVSIRPFLSQYIQKNKGFLTILKFFKSKRNVEVLQAFDKVSSKAAVLKSNSVIDTSHEFLHGDSRLSYDLREDPHYELLIRYLSSIELDYSQNSRIPSEILDSAEWTEVHEKLSLIVHNFKHSVTRTVPRPFDQRPSIKFNTLSQDHASMLIEFINNPWIGLYHEGQKRYEYKQKYDFTRLKNEMLFAEFIINGGSSGVPKVRKVYDRFYRWPLLKEKNPCKIAITPEAPFADNLQETHHGNMENSPISVSTTVNTKYSEKGSHKWPIEQISVSGSYFGEIDISDSYIELKFSGEIKPEGLFPGSALKFSCRSKICCKVWSHSEILEVLPRRFIHKHSAIELVLVSGKSFLINCFSESSRLRILNKIKSLGCTRVWDKPALDLCLESSQAEWRCGKICTFEYLMIVNRLAGRCSHDLSQYPVFPWVLSEYSLESLDKEAPENYRKFEFPIGAQSEPMRTDASNKFKMWTDEDMQPHHYGSHYSNAGIVTHYLLRIEPYTAQAKSIQGGELDIPDRLFFAVDIAWNSVKSSTGDVKELVPELFYQVYALQSYSDQTYGTTQNAKQIMHVLMPAWAGSCWDFLKKHRMCLESNFVSAELSNWIDLVFGYKQTGKNAKESFNLFCESTYEESFRKRMEKSSGFDSESLVEQAYHFGQTPICVFPNKPHPKREEIGRINIFDNIMNECDQKRYRFKKVHAKNSSIGTPHAIFYTEKRLILIKSIEDSVYLAKYSLSTGKKYLTCKEYPLEHLHKPRSLHQFHSLALTNSSSTSYSSSSFALCQDKYLVSALDSSTLLLVHSLKGKLLTCLRHHTSLVTHLSTSASPSLLFSASLDSTITSWRPSAEEYYSQNLGYFGHRSPILQLAAIESFQLLVSASVQGIVLIHDFRRAFCLKKIDQMAVSMATSELGIIAIWNRNSLRYYGVNAEKIAKSKEGGTGKNLKFNFAGDYCIEVEEKFIKFRDPTKVSNKCKVDIDGVKDIVVHPLEKAIYMCRVKKNNRCAVYIIKQILK